MNATVVKRKPKKGKRNLELKHVVLRGDVYYFRIAVPQHLKGTFGKREHFWESLRVKISDENAEAKVLGQVLVLRKKYEAMFGKGKPSAQDFNLAAFTEFAKSFLGVNYGTAVQVASAQEYVEMMADRVQKFEKIDNPSETIVAVVSGGLALPALTMSQALNRYKELSSEKFGLNSDKRARDKKWRPFAQAVDEWNNAMGTNHDVTKLKNADTWAFKEKLVGMIAAKKFDLASARKKIMWLRLITEKVLRVDYGIESSPFEKVVIEGKAKKGKRLPFTKDECKAVLDRIISGKSNDDLKALNVLSSMTGATCKELCLMTADDIHVSENEAIPYISIRPNELRDNVKSDGDRIRDIPVFGAGLAWLKKFPNGFERYRRHNGSEALSASSNKIIGEVVEGKTFYSYRHMIADALRNSGCGDNLKSSIMGHTSANPHELHYGSGFTLEKKLAALMNALAETPEEDVRKQAA